MTWQPIARQDAALTYGSRTVRYLLGLLCLFVLGAAYFYPMVVPEANTTAHFAGFVTGWLTRLVALVGIILGYNAIVGGRKSGALLLSLALPHSRRDVVLGTFVGRVGVLSGAILVGLAGAGALVVYPYGELVLAPFVGFVGLTVAYGAIWTGIGVAISIAVATRQRALILGFGTFCLFALAWSPLEGAVEFGLQSIGLLASELPDPVAFVFDLEPGRLFERLVAGFVDPSASVEGPWYRSEWVALALFACWLVGPLALAFRRFEGSDLR